MRYRKIHGRKKILSVRFQYLHGLEYLKLRLAAVILDFRTKVSCKFKARTPIPFMSLGFDYRKPET